MEYFQIKYEIKVPSEFVFNMLASPNKFTEFYLTGENVRYVDTPYLHKSNLEVGDEFIFENVNENFYSKTLAKTTEIIKNKLIRYRYTHLSYLPKLYNEYDNQYAKTNEKYHLELLNENPMESIWSITPITDFHSQITFKIVIIGDVNLLKKISLFYSKRKYRKEQEKIVKNFIRITEKEFAEFNRKNSNLIR